MGFDGKEKLPVLGVGISFCNGVADTVCAYPSEFDFCEAILDNVIDGTLDARFSTSIFNSMPLVGHAVQGSLGSLEKLRTSYFSAMGKIVQSLGCHWFSDHLAYTRSSCINVEQLMPVQFSEANAAFVSKRIKQASMVLPVPLLIENSAYYFCIPGSEMAEIEFLLRILKLSKCGLLLDVNNLVANAKNHGYDARKYIDRIPAQVVVEVHVAGGAMRGDLYIDTHGHAVSSEVLELLSYVVHTKMPKAVVLEREKNFPTALELITEIQEVRRCCGATMARTAALCGSVDARFRRSSAMNLEK